MCEVHIAMASHFQKMLTLNVASLAMAIDFLHSKIYSYVYALQYVTTNICSTM